MNYVDYTALYSIACPDIVNELKLVATSVLESLYGL